MCRERAAEARELADAGREEGAGGELRRPLGQARPSGRRGGGPSRDSSIT